MDDSFGKKLIALRNQKGFQQNELADLVGIYNSYLSDIENDKCPPPSESVIIALSKRLNVDKRILLEAAKKADPELTDYIVQDPRAADFLRMAKDQEFEDNDWDKLSQLAKISGLGKEE